MSDPRPIAVVLMSGGMDSGVTAVEARAKGHELALFHGNYGQRTESRELSCFHAIADRLGVPIPRRLVADMRYLGALGGSSLTDRGIPVEPSRIAPEARETQPRGNPAMNAASGPNEGSSALEAGRPIDGRGRDSSLPNPGLARSAPASGDAELGACRSGVPSSYVPFRNAHFLSIAVSWGETLGASAIYMGAVEEDSSGYPDCREAYYRAFQEVIDLGTRPETKIRIVTPLIHLDKAAIVRRGLELGAPFELTWSCYSESEIACGVCDSCALRLRGFERAGAIDPIPYRERVR